MSMRYIANHGFRYCYEIENEIVTVKKERTARHFWFKQLLIVALTTVFLLLLFVML